MNILNVKNLTKKYEDLVAVNNISFNVEKGEVLGLVGPNGAGKSTTISMISGLLVPDRGKILFESDNEFASWHNNIGLVPQDLAIYSDLSAEENVSFFASLYGIKGHILRERVNEVLGFVGLEEHRKKRVDKFSGGMKRRLNIACAIAHKPKLIIMDEPTVGIDPQSRNCILDSIRKFQQQGTTVIYTSHYMEEVEEICNKILIIDHGKIILSGLTSEVKNKFNTEKILVVNTVNQSSKEKELKEDLELIEGVNLIDLKENLITIHCNDSINDYTPIFNVLSKYNISIAGIESKTPTLEEIFLSLTGKELRD